jgi:HSP20 family molecular chaperone IbpA
MQFVIEPNFMEPFCQTAFQCRRPGKCPKTENVEKKWQQKINLTQIPTKPEDLNVKMEKDSNTLSVSGKSDVTKERNSGLKICSTHTWSKDIAIPENVDQSTLTAEMVENILTISAQLKKHEIAIERTAAEPEQELTQEKMD